MTYTGCDGGEYVDATAGHENMTQGVVLSRAVMTEDGRTVVVHTPFEQVPNWVKSAVRPRWDHPSDCECADCWITMESYP